MGQKTIQVLFVWSQGELNCHFYIPSKNFKNAICCAYRIVSQSLLDSFLLLKILKKIWAFKSFELSRAILLENK